MGEKVEKKVEGEKKAAEGGDKKAAEGGDKKAADGGPITVVLKLDLHCEGCAKKVKSSVKHFEGVSKVKTDCDANKLTIIGNVDPAWVRERVEYKTKKKVELVSPQPAKKEEKKADDKKPEEKKADDKKPKEPAVSTVVMKMNLHCDGCARKIKKVVKKNIDGVKSVNTDMSKDLITVTGTMNVKLLTVYLKEKLKRSVDIVPPKKDDGGGDKKGKEGEKKEEKKEGGGDKKEAKAGGEAPKNADVVKAVEVNKLEYSFNPQTHYAMAPMYNQSFYNQDYGLPMYHHQGYHADPSTSYAIQYAQAPAPPPPTYINQNMNDQMFSDENPNGCTVM